MTSKSNLLELISAKSSSAVSAPAVSNKGPAIISPKGERLGTVVEWGDRTIEVAIEHEIDQLVDSAASGDLTQRIATENKQGFFKGLGEGLNKLVSVCEGVIDDTVEGI